MDKKTNADAIRCYSFLKIFADNDSLTADELAFIEKLALEDRLVDAAESEVLSAIFAKAEKLGVTAGVHAEIESFKQRFGVA